MTAHDTQARIWVESKDGQAVHNLETTVRFFLRTASQEALASQQVVHSQEDDRAVKHQADDKAVKDEAMVMLTWVRSFMSLLVQHPPDGYVFRNRCVHAYMLMSCTFIQIRQTDRQTDRQTSIFLQSTVFITAFCATHAHARTYLETGTDIVDVVFAGQQQAGVRGGNGRACSCMDYAL
jgi:hypothetical protein